MAQNFTSFTPIEEAEPQSPPKFTSFTPIGEVKPAPAPKEKPAPVTKAAPTFEPTYGEDVWAPIVAQQQPEPKRESVMEGFKGTPPTVDYAENRRARDRSVSPESVMFTPARQLDEVDAQIYAQQYKDKKSAAAKQAARDKLRQDAAAEDYGVTDFLKDSGVDLTKGVAGLGEAYVGLLDITSGGAAGRVLGDMGYSPKSINKFLTGFQSLTRKNQDQDVKDAQGFLGTLKELSVNPASLVGSIVESLPGTLTSGVAAGRYVRFLTGKASKEALAKGLVGAEAEAFIKDRVTQQTMKIAAVASGTEGAQTAGSIAEAGRQEGTEYKDYVLPALAAGFGTTAIGLVSGKVGQKLGIGDIETGATGTGSFKKRFTGEVLKESLFEELPQSAQEQIFRNIATGRPWDENVDKSSAQGLAAGAGMAAAHVSKNQAVKSAKEAIANRLFPVQEERVEPSLDNAELLNAAPASVYRSMDDMERDRTNEIYNQLLSQNIPADNARRIAAKRVLEERKQKIKELVVEPTDDEIQQRAKELIDGGFDPVVAMDEAQKQIIEERKADALAQAETQGEQDVGQTIAKPSGDGVSMAGQPDTDATAAGVGDLDTSRVVSARQDATGVDERAPAQSAPVGFREANKQEQKQDSTKETLDLGNGAKVSFASDGDTFVKDPAGKPAGLIRFGDGRRGVFQNALELPAYIPEAIRQPLMDYANAARANYYAPTEQTQAALTDARAKLEAAVNQTQQAQQTTPAPVAVDPIEFAKRSADSAIADQANFESLEESIGAQRDNIADTLREQGVNDQSTIDKAIAAYDEEINKQQGKLTPEDQDTIQAELDELQNASPEDQAFIEDYAADQEAEEQAEEAAVKAETKKRGRPLNDEETRAVKETERKKNRAEYTKAERQLSGIKNNLTAQLDAANEAIDEATVENEEALKQAQEDKRAQKASVITKLLDMEQQFRGTALGKRVKAILDDRNRISQEELTKVKRGRDILSGRTPLASRGGRVKGKANAAFSKATNASQALTIIAKNGNMFQKFLANRLRGFVNGVKFVVIEQGDTLPEDVQAFETDWERADAMFVPDSKTVYVRGASFGENQGVNNIDVLHEILHAATNQKIALGLLPGAKNTKLARFVNELILLSLRAEAAYLAADVKGLIPPELRARVESTVDVDDDGRAYYGIFELPQEFLAYGMSDEDFQEFLGRMESDQANETGFTAFARMLYNEWAKAFGKDGLSAMSDLINVTDKILDAEKTPGMRLVEKGLPPLASRKKKPPPPPPSVVSEDEDEFGNPVRSASELAKDAAVAREKVRVSRQGEEGEGIEAMQMARDPEKVKSVLRALVARNWQNMSHGAVKKLVTLPTFTFLADLSGIKSLKDVEKQMQEMIGMSNSLQAGAQKILASMKKELNPFFRSAKQFRTDFENLVYETTIAQIDPSDPKTKQRSKEIDALWNKVGEKGQRMYRMLKQYYENIIDLYADLLDQQINGIQGLAPEAKENLIKVLRQTFEAGARIRPYFPLVRRGSYWLRVEEKVGKETKQAFYLFETVGERNQRASELAAERRGDVEDFMDKGIFDMNDTTASLRAATQNSSAMLTQIFDAIDKEKFDSPAAKEALKDAIYQVYLNTMPEQSFRNQFIRRKDRAGFSTDVLRNVATTASNTSMHLAKLKYSPLLRNSVSAARDAVKGRSNLTPFVEEAQRRVNLALEEPEHGWADAFAGFANKISYFWFLSSASSALIQPASVYIAGLPVLGANHNNITAAAKELSKMVVLMNQYSVVRDNGDGTSSIVAPSLANNTTLPEAERDAIREMSQRGVAQSSYASEVWGYQSIPTRDAATWLGKTGQLGKEAADLLVGSLMHNTERLTREAVFLASYRLGIKRGLTQDAAINQAVSDVNEALANYDITNRPRFMQRGIGKMLLQFKMFPLHTALLLATNFYKMMPLLNKEGKKAAATKFFGIYLTAGSIAGLAGIPFFSTTLGVMASLFKALQEEDDWPEELKDMDAETWFRTVFLEEKLGDVSIGGIPVSEILDSGPLNALTGLAIAERIGLNDLFGRDTKEAKTEREGLQQFMIEKAGPFASVGLTMADAYDAYSVGDYSKMRERMAPSVLRNLLLADKLSKEGMKDARGQEVVPADEITQGQIIAQAIGFRPAILARMSETNFKLTGAEQRIVNERNRLMQAAKIAARKENKAGDEQLYKLVDGPITKFNDKYPEFAIEDDQLEKSLEDDLTARAESRLGFPITEKNVRLVEPSLEVLERRIKRIREKAK